MIKNPKDIRWLTNLTTHRAYIKTNTHELYGVVILDVLLGTSHADPLARIVYKNPDDQVRRHLDIRDEDIPGLEVGVIPGIYADFIHIGPIVPTTPQRIHTMNDLLNASRKAMENDYLIAILCDSELLTTGTPHVVEFNLEGGKITLKDPLTGESTSVKFPGHELLTKTYEVSFLRPDKYIEKTRTKD